MDFGKNDIINLPYW